MNTTDKKLTFAEAPAVLRHVRESGKTIVQCHGTFDLLHPGHIVHLEEAKAIGDILVVTITADRFVNKGPGRPVFNASLRTRSLAALACVDYVIVVPYPAAVEAIECVRPNIYCKGKEYERSAVDVTGNIQNDLKTVARLGGQVRYVGLVVFSATRLLNRFFDVYPPDARMFFRQMIKRYPFEDIRRRIDAWPSVLVPKRTGQRAAASLICLDEADLKNMLGGKKTGTEVAVLRFWVRRPHVSRVVFLRRNLTAVGVDRCGAVCEVPAFQASQRLTNVRRDIFAHVACLGTVARLPLAPCLFVALIAVHLVDDRHAKIERGRLLKGCEAALNV